VGYFYYKLQYIFCPLTKFSLLMMTKFSWSIITRTYSNDICHWCSMTNIKHYQCHIKMPKWAKYILELIIKIPHNLNLKKWKMDTYIWAGQIHVVYIYTEHVKSLYHILYLHINIEYVFYLFMSLDKHVLRKNNQLN
jgi:hypothetical protein